MSCVAAAAPAVDCVKRPGSGREGAERGRRGQTLKLTSCCFLKHSLRRTCSHRRCRAASSPLYPHPPNTHTPPSPLHPPLPSRAKSFEVNLHVGVESVLAPLNMQHTQNQLNVSFLKSTQAGEARTNTHAHAPKHTHTRTHMYTHTQTHMFHFLLTRIQLLNPHPGSGSAFRRSSTLTSLR